MLKSSACTQKQLLSDTFQDWTVRLHLSRNVLHRKYWEYCYIAQALHERGLLRPGMRGLGFAVGREPLVALFASLGCDIVATDLDAERAAEVGWVATNQHSSSIDHLNDAGICPAEEFRRRVSFRCVDMNHLPSDLRGFDFIWSSCSIEHLGNIWRGQRFMLNMARCLKPGGVAIHTTEYNVDSDDATLASGCNVVFRRQDLRFMSSLLQTCGHRVEPLDFDTGSDPADLVVDEPPHNKLPHLKLRLGPFASTSFGIIVTAGNPSWSWPRRMLAKTRLRFADNGWSKDVVRALLAQNRAA